MNLAESVKDYNKDHQEMVDNVIWSFNEVIQAYTRIQNIYVPDFAEPVHRQFGDDIKNMYSHLRDGLHLKEEALNKWAKITVRVAEKTKI